MNFRARLSSYFSLKKDKEEDKGLTLLEIAGAMIIIAIVVALAMSQMSSTMASSDNQRELKNLQTIATKMKQYKFQGRYTGTDYIKTLTESGALPADMIAGGNKAKTHGVVMSRLLPQQTNMATLSPVIMFLKQTVLS